MLLVRSHRKVGGVYRVCRPQPPQQTPSHVVTSGSACGGLLRATASLGVLSRSAPREQVKSPREHAILRGGGCPVAALARARVAPWRRNVRALLHRLFLRWGSRSRLEHGFIAQDIHRVALGVLAVV